MDSKRYYARVPDSRFVFSDTQEAIFLHGFVDINERTAPGKFQGLTKEDPNNGRPKYKVYQEELDAILGRNPMIFIQDKLPEKLPEVPQNAKSEAAIAAEDSALLKVAGIDKVVVQQQVGPAGSGAPTDVNMSTADPELSKAFASVQVNETPVKPIASAPVVNSRLAEIRAAAANAAAAQSVSVK
jgi:hypothetical protein